MHWRKTCNPLQYSFLENPRDRGAWWATICGVPQSWTRLEWLSSSSSNRYILYIYIYISTLSLRYLWIIINNNDLWIKIQDNTIVSIYLYKCLTTNVIYLKGENWEIYECFIMDEEYVEIFLMHYWAYYSIKISYTLGRFIPKYFILFISMANGIVSLISLSLFSLLVYKNERGFCVLILYPATLLHFLLALVIFWWSL